MKAIIISAVLLLLVSLCNAQSPESGWFWAIKKQTLNKKIDSVKYDGMGWVETPTGQTAFEFSDSIVTIYYNGIMGKDYKNKEVHKVINRNRVSEDESGFSVYQYNLKYGGEYGLYKIVVWVDNDNYDDAQIALFELKTDSIKCMAYRCSRHYK